MLRCRGEGEATHAAALNASELMKSSASALMLATESAQMESSSLVLLMRSCKYEGQPFVSLQLPSKRPHLEVGKHETVALTRLDGRSLEVEQLNEALRLNGIRRPVSTVSQCLGAQQSSPSSTRSPS